MNLEMHDLISFLSVKDVVEHYNLASEELEGIHSPVSVLLYHVCKAISEKTQETKVKRVLCYLFWLRIV